MSDLATNHHHTPHGHPCCNLAPIGDRRQAVARCGGPGMCTACARAAADIHGQPTATAPATDRPNPPDLDALRRAIQTRDRVVAEIQQRAHAIGLPMSAEQARIAYDVTREELAR